MLFYTKYLAGERCELQLKGRARMQNGRVEKEFSEGLEGRGRDVGIVALVFLFVLLF